MTRRSCFPMLALSLLISSAYGQATETQRLHKLCELWGGIKYFHPKLAYRQVDWDKALVEAIPKVRAAKNAADYRASVNAMLGYLEDPLARVAENGESGSPSSSWKKGEKLKVQGDVVVLELASAMNEYFSPNYYTFNEQLTKAVSAGKGIVFDCRPKDLTPIEVFRQQIAFMGFFGTGIHGTIPAATERFRRHLGYVPATGSTSGGYESTLNTAVPQAIQGAQPSKKSVVVLIDSGARPGMLPMVIGAQAAGQCAVVVEGSKLSDPTAALTVLDMGEGVAVLFPTSEVVSPDGHIGFQPDKFVPFDSSADKALEEAIQMASQPIKQRNKGDAGLLPPTPLVEKTYPEMTYPNTEYRLLSLFRYWNVIRYFFPYLNLTGRDWADVLDESIPRFIAAKDASEYGRAVALVGAEIRDSHGSMSGAQLNGIFPGFVPGFRTRYIEGKFIVTSLSEAVKAKGIAQGDELLEVDGKDPRSVVEEMTRTYAVSRPETNLYTFTPLGGDKDTVGKFKIRGADGTVREFELPRNNERPTILLPPRPQQQPYGVLPSGFGYIDLTRVQSSDVSPSMKAIHDTPALIFDMRGYPNGTGWTYGAMLTDKRVSIARFLKPDAEIWSPTTGNPNGRLFVDKIDAMPGEKYKGKVVVLINFQAISQAEHTCLILKSARPDLVFIGQATAGANGDVTNVVLPGNITMGFSGQGVSWVDGRQLQRVGVQPDIKAEPTIGGTLTGKDDILEAAISYLKGQTGVSR